MSILIAAGLVQVLFGLAMFLASLFLILLVLVQRGRGGGLSGAFGGMGGQSAFGAKAGDTFTKITIGAAAVWIILCMLATFMLGNSDPNSSILTQNSSSPLMNDVDSASDISDDLNALDVPPSPPVEGGADATNTDAGEAGASSAAPESTPVAAESATSAPAEVTTDAAVTDVPDADATPAK